jgi:hypothetical protein
MEHRYIDRAGAGSNVVAFRPAPSSPARLTLRDRLDIDAWRDQASMRGYDRLVIHERCCFDPPEFEAFLGIYRRGEAWARWNVARCGAWVLAWCSANGTDIGRFDSMGDALQMLLGEARVLV